VRRRHALLGGLAALGAVGLGVPGLIRATRPRPADSPAEQCAAILRILDDQAERDRLSAAGRARVLTSHSWPNSMKRLDAIIDRCIAGYRTRSLVQAQVS